MIGIYFITGTYILYMDKYYGRSGGGDWLLEKMVQIFFVGRKNCVPVGRGVLVVRIAQYVPLAEA